MSQHLVITLDGVSVLDGQFTAGGVTPPNPTPIPGVVMLTATTNPPAPTAGGGGKHTYQAGVAYAFAWPSNGSSLAVDTSSGAANAQCETWASPVPGDAEWAKTHTFSVPSSGFPITYLPYASGQASGASVGVARPPTNCVPPFPAPYFGGFRMNVTGEAIVQFSLGA